MPIAFFVKCRPQGADIISLLRRVNRVFIGYPAWRKGIEYDRRRIRPCLVDVTTPEKEWLQFKTEIVDYRREHTTNRNLALEVQEGSMIVVPRPADGVCWLAEVAGTFEIVDAPDWTDDYLALRQAQGLEVEDESSHVGDVVQGWAVHDVRPVPFSRIPRWIMAPMLSRATFGRLKGYADLGLEALPVLARLYAGEDIEPLVPTTNVDTVARRLLTYVGPSSFEHLCVALLQLENPHERWWHIGGSGDGGVDGLGTDEREATIGLLQCKWRLWWAGDFNNEAVAARGAGHRYVLASLMHPADCGQDSAAALIFWGRSEIAALVVKHRAVLPLAKSLRISG